MKQLTIIFLCVTMLAIATRCAHQTEPVPTISGIQPLTLRPGESRQLNVDNTTYRITYTGLQVKFSEGVGEGNTTYFYRLGEVRLIVNGDSVGVRATGRYDSKGGRQPRTWAYLSDSLEKVRSGSITIGVANFYPAATDLSGDEGYAVDLLVKAE